MHVTVGDKMLMLTLALLLNLLDFGAPAAPENNVCKHFEDYIALHNNPNCYYNPDVTLDPSELIKKYTGREEYYNVTTEDGYILQVFRMPRKDPKGVILLQHPMGMSSKVYVVQGNQSTAYLLWQEGYDVWLGNQRGTRYGLGHVNLTANDDKFWDFSLDETGYYDTPAFVNLVRTKTNSKIIFIGHSMGTTNGLIYASRRPDEAKSSIERFVFASVSAYYKYGDTPMMVFGDFEPYIRQLLQTLGLRRELIPNFPLLTRIDQQLTRTNPLVRVLQNAFLFYVFGNREDEADPTFYGVDAFMSLDNVSWKLALHYLQLFRVKDRFQMFDYGAVENQKRYGSKVPPENPIWNIKVPIHMVASSQDRLTTVKDAELLYSRLPEAAKSKHGFGLRISELSHSGIQNGRRRVDIFVKSLMNFLNEIR